MWEAHEDLHSNVRRMQFAPQDAVAPYHDEAILRDREIAYAPSDPTAATIELHMEVKDCADRLREHEAGINQLMGDIATIQGDMDMGPRVAALVGALQQVAPKVMDQEAAVRELHERLGRIESRGSVPAASVDGRGGSSPGMSDAALARIGRLEVEVSRLTVEVEGEGEDEMPCVHGNEVVELEETDQPGRPRLTRRASATE